MTFGEDRDMFKGPQIEMIRTPCGIFCGGLEDFVIPALTEDDPMESIVKMQHGSTEAIVAEIVDMKARFGLGSFRATFAGFLL